MLDVIFIDKYVNEINSALHSARVDKIYQPSKLELFLSIRKPGETVFLRLDCSADNSHFRITSQSKDNPSNPPAFCMLLRKYLVGSKIIEIKVIDNERIIDFIFQGRHPNGHVAKWVLSLEIMGKHSNIIFYEQDSMEVLGLLKPVHSSIRELRVGGQYLLPPTQQKIPEELLSYKEFMTKTIGDENLNLDKLIVKYFPKASPILAQEFLYDNNYSNVPLVDLNDNDVETLIKKYKEYLQLIQYKPVMLSDTQGHWKDFYCLELDHLNHKYKSVDFSSYSELVGKFYDVKELKDHISQYKAKLNKIINKHLKKLTKKQKTLQKDLHLYSNSDHFKVTGDLLMANLHTMKKGMTSIDVLNYYTSVTETISLDPSRNPIQNSQKYYKKYSKAKRGLQIVSDNLYKVNDEILYLESIALFIDDSNDVNELTEIERELEKEDYINVRPEKGSKKGQNQKNPPQDSRPLEFLSSDDFVILVGKNNKQNDQLTLRTANKEDIWLHVKEIPGSHVIVRNGANAPETTLVEAASLAAFHSKGKLSSNVPVDYTHVKNVFKPKGAKPGMVNYVENKTIYVTPSEDIVERLRRVSENR